jgi:hypothetical protein
VYYNEAGEPIGWDQPSHDLEFCHYCGATGHSESECPFEYRDEEE